MSIDTPHSQVSQYPQPQSTSLSCSSNKEPCRIVISDLDGTLFNSKHSLSKFTRDTIVELDRRGIIFSIATGRHYLDAKYTLEQLGIQSILISANGAMINERDGTPLFQSILPASHVKQITSVPLPPDVQINMYTPYSWLVAEETAHLMTPSTLIDSHQSGFRYQLTSREKFHEYPCIKLYFTVHPSENIAAIEQAKRSIEALDCDLHVTFSTLYTFEVMSYGVNKGTAVSKLLEYEKLSSNSAIAFGDGMNDLEMLSLIDRSLLMGNADPRLIAALPQRKVIATNDNDAVANYIANFIL